MMVKAVLVLFRVGLLALVVSTPARAQELVLGAPRQAMPIVSWPDADTLINLGLSPRGHLATLLEEHEEEDLGYRWTLRLVDLRTDAVLYEDSWRATGGPTITDRATLWSQRGPAFFEALMAVGIPAPGVPVGEMSGLALLPLVVGSEVFTVDVSTAPVDGDPDHSHVAVIGFRSSASGRKEIGRIPVNLVGGALLSVPFPMGVWLSPHERRVAVLLLQVGWRMHGPPLGGRWTVLGADLDKGFIAP